jgi:hypothetical protein
MFRRAGGSGELDWTSTQGIRTPACKCRPRPLLAIVVMRSFGVKKTGEPWEMRFTLREQDAEVANGYARMFLLEHDECLSEVNRRPPAVVCESESTCHRNWGHEQAPDDIKAFDAFVVATVRGTATR